jgi:ABC-type nitrate/sulfonate/bicarbonate transport system ATPase subunit
MLAINYPSTPKMEAKGASLRVNGLTHAFLGPDGSRRIVLNDISISANPGEFTCLVGASGCGKTTLLRIIGGLISPTKGEVSVTSPAGPAASGFVFQSDALMPWRTVEANVGLGLELQGWSKSDRRDRVYEVLKMVKLERFGRHFPRELSGGMRQRVNIARSLAIKPQLLLMDEPFAALDAQTREVMQAELLALCEDIGATVVFVTHQIEEAVLLADQIVILSASPGRLREVFTPPMQRPRDASMRRSPEFVEAVDHVWNLIRYEVEESVRKELSRS